MFIFSNSYLFGATTPAKLTRTWKGVGRILMGDEALIKYRYLMAKFWRSERPWLNFSPPKHRLRRIACAIKMQNSPSLWNQGKMSRKLERRVRNRYRAKHQFKVDLITPFSKNFPRWKRIWRDSYFLLQRSLSLLFKSLLSPNCSGEVFLCLVSWVSQGKKSLTWTLSCSVALNTLILLSDSRQHTEQRLVKLIDTQIRHSLPDIYTVHTQPRPQKGRRLRYIVHRPINKSFRRNVESKKKNFCQ